jgi:hypothetical protein
MIKPMKIKRFRVRSPAPTTFKKEIKKILYSCGQGCQMVYFQTKNPNMGKF